MKCMRKSHAYGARDACARRQRQILSLVSRIGFRHASGEREVIYVAGVLRMIEVVDRRAGGRRKEEAEERVHRERVKEEAFLAAPSTFLPILHLIYVLTLFIC
jgi:hypothetical protein